MGDFIFYLLAHSRIGVPTVVPAESIGMSTQLLRFIAESGCCLAICCCGRAIYRHAHTRLLPQEWNESAIYLKPARFCGGQGAVISIFAILRISEGERDLLAT